jgi:inward rectifier potassium channel
LSKLRGKRPERKPQLVRLGYREIETLGLSQEFWSDLYHRSMTVYRPVFFGSAAALFVALTAVFGFLYSLGRGAADGRVMPDDESCRSLEAP